MHRKEVLSGQFLESHLCTLLQGKHPGQGATFTWVALLCLASVVLLVLGLLLFSQPNLTAVLEAPPQGTGTPRTSSTEHPCVCLPGVPGVPRAAGDILVTLGPSTPSVTSVSSS